jgi:PAS domain-containing protein
MLVLLAEPGLAAVAAARQEAFERALQRAKDNITKSEEVPVIERIEQHGRAALAGDARAVMVVVQALQSLTTINRRAMMSADQEAQRLGVAGAWVAVFIAVFAFVISLIVVRRLERHVLYPLIELHDVLAAVRAGNRYRRCRIIEAPEEIQRVLHSVNALLEHRLNGSDAAPHRRVHFETPLAHAALIHLLEQRPEAMVLVDAHGAVIASNNRGLAILSSPDGEHIKRLFKQLPVAERHDLVEPIALQGGSGWLCILRLPAPNPSCIRRHS